MLTIINFEKRQSASGKEFFSLILQGGVEMVRSAETGQYYATIKRCSVTSTLDEEACKAMVGEQLDGKIEKVQCTPYEFVIPQTGEVVELSHRWIRNPGPNASGAGSQYDQFLQGCLRTCERYQLRKITIIRQFQRIEIHFTLLRTINQTAIPPTEFIQSKHMQSNQIRHYPRMPTIAIGKAMNRYQTVLKTDCDFFR